MSANKATVLQPGGLAQRLSVALVVDDGVLARRVQEVLERNRWHGLVEVDSVAVLGAHAAPDDIDVIVLRAGATRSQMLETFKAARARYPHKPIIGIWPDDERRDDQRAIKAGLDGLIQQSQIDTALGATIQAVCSGLLCFPRRPAAGIDGQSLSSREKQVLGMLIMGFTNAEIGRRLFLAESTVKSHLSSAYMKLGVRSRKDAAALILDPDEGLGTGILAISRANG